MSRSEMPGSGRTQLELCRLPDDRKAYQLGDVGTVRRRWFGWRSAEAYAADLRWTFAASGVWIARLRARDDEDTLIGEYLPRALRGGGTLRWHGREFTVRPTSRWRSRYALIDRGQEIVTIEPRTRSRRPVTMTVPHSLLADPGLLLFVAVVAAWSASEATNTAAGGAAATSAATMG